MYRMILRKSERHTSTLLTHDREASRSGLNLQEANPRPSYYWRDSRTVQTPKSFLSTFGWRRGWRYSCRATPPSTAPGFKTHARVCASVLGRGGLPPSLGPPRRAYKHTSGGHPTPVRPSPLGGLPGPSRVWCSGPGGGRSGGGAGPSPTKAAGESPGSRWRCARGPDLCGRGGALSH